MLIEDHRWHELVSALDAALKRIDVLEANAVLDPDDATWLAGEVVYGPRLSCAFIARHELAGTNDKGEPRTIGSSDQSPTTVMGFLRAVMFRGVQYPRCFIACGPDDPGKVALIESRIDDNGIINTSTTFFADAPQHLLKELTINGDGVPSPFTARELIAVGWPEVHPFAPGSIDPGSIGPDAPASPSPAPISGPVGVAEEPERESAAAREDCDAWD